LATLKISGRSETLPEREALQATGQLHSIGELPPYRRSGNGRVR
jgi:hypothetical protein